MRGLSALASRCGGNAKDSFSIYNVSEARSGASASVGVELVEIHNDEDSVYSSALDQVRSFEQLVT